MESTKNFPFDVNGCDHSISNLLTPSASPIPQSEYLANSSGNSPLDSYYYNSLQASNKTETKGRNVNVSFWSSGIDSTSMSSRGTLDFRSLIVNGSDAMYYALTPSATPTTLTDDFITNPNGTVNSILWSKNSDSTTLSSFCPLDLRTFSVNSSDESISHKASSVLFDGPLDLRCLNLNSSAGSIPKTASAIPIRPKYFHPYYYNNHYSTSRSSHLHNRSDSADVLLSHMYNAANTKCYQPPPPKDNFRHSRNQQQYNDPYTDLYPMKHKPQDTSNAPPPPSILQHNFYTHQHHYPYSQQFPTQHTQYNVTPPPHGGWQHHQIPIIYLQPQQTSKKRKSSRQCGDTPPPSDPHQYQQLHYYPYIRQLPTKHKPQDASKIYKSSIQSNYAPPPCDIQRYHQHQQQYHDPRTDLAPIKRKYQSEELKNANRINDAPPPAHRWEHYKQQHHDASKKCYESLPPCDYMQHQEQHHDPHTDHPPTAIPQPQDTSKQCEGSRKFNDTPPPSTHQRHPDQGQQDSPFNHKLLTKNKTQEASEKYESSMQSNDAPPPRGNTQHKQHDKHTNHKPQDASEKHESSGQSNDGPPPCDTMQYQQQHDTHNDQHPTKRKPQDASEENECNYAPPPCDKTQHHQHQQQHDPKPDQLPNKHTPKHASKKYKSSIHSKDAPPLRYNLQHQHQHYDLNTDQLLTKHPQPQGTVEVRKSSMQLNEAVSGAGDPAFHELNAEFKNKKISPCKSNQIPRTDHRVAHVGVSPLTEEQTTEFERYYSEKQIITGPRLVKMSEKLSLDKYQVQKWFKNRRQRDYPTIISPSAELIAHCWQSVINHYMSNSSLQVSQQHCPAQYFHVPLNPTYTAANMQQASFIPQPDSLKLHMHQQEIQNISISQNTDNSTDTPMGTSMHPKSVQPTAVQPTAVQPTALQPTALQPTALQPTTVYPRSVQPTALQPTTVHPRSVQPTALQPTALQSTAVHPTLVQPTAVEPTTVHPTTSRPTILYQIKMKPPTVHDTTVSQPAPAPNSNDDAL